MGGTQPQPQPVGKTANGKKGRSSSSGIMTLAAAMLAAFLIGRFLLGPVISRRHAVRTSPVAAEPISVQSKPTPLLLSLLTLPARERPRSPAPEDTRTAEDTGQQSPPTAPGEGPMPSPPIIATPGQPDATEQPSAYSVQVARLSDQASADELVTRLTSAGFPASVHRVEKAGAVTYAVLSGTFSQRSAAEDRRDTLKARGFEAFISTND